MINVYIVSGFLGAGKTTFIKKLLNEHKFEKVMLLENEFGEVGVDSAFFDSSLKMLEINNGCICCSLQGDFKDALEEIESMGITDLIIEPSGVGKLSDIIDVVKKDEDYRIISHICIVDVKTAVKYHNNFKEYFDDQVKAANALILSHLDVSDEEKIHNVIHMLKELNEDALILDKSVDEIDIAKLLNIIVSGGEILPEFEHHHHDHEECCCGHHHHHDHEECHHDHHHQNEAGTAAQMACGVVCHIFRSQFFTGFVSVDGFMLRAVILKDPQNIVHTADQQKVDQKDDDADNALQQTAAEITDLRTQPCTEPGR